MLSSFRNSVAGFTLIELMVTLAIIGLLAALVLPALGSARRSSTRAACASNLRQLALANTAYAADHGYYVAAAADVRGRNNQRWHGERESRRQPFDPAKGPLAPYLGVEARVRQCPEFRPEANGFEAGCGGYGYNACGVGSQAYVLGAYRGAARGMAPGAIADASKTVMFTDAGFLQEGELIEYSFAEPRRHLSDSAPPREAYPAIPSIHFRHEGLANVVWVDGHVSSMPLSGHHTPSYTDAQIGWFGPEDNSYFDPY